jgi:hypothetical protein
LQPDHRHHILMTVDSTRISVFHWMTFFLSHLPCEVIKSKFCLNWSKSPNLQNIHPILFYQWYCIPIKIITQSCIIFLFHFLEKGGTGILCHTYATISRGYCFPKFQNDLKIFHLNKKFPISFIFKFQFQKLVHPDMSRECPISQIGKKNLEIR